MLRQRRCPSSRGRLEQRPACQLRQKLQWPLQHKLLCQLRWWVQLPAWTLLLNLHRSLQLHSLRWVHTEQLALRVWVPAF